MSNLTYPAYLNKLSNDINWSFNIISSSIGIPCNLVSIVIYTRLMRNKTNMGFLGVWQCSIDLALLLFFLLLFRSSTTLGINLPGQTDSGCKFLTFLRRFILHASSWIPVVTTFDRFVFVFYSQDERFKFMHKKRMLTLLILVVFVVITILDIPNMLFYKSGSACVSDFPITVSSDIISICLRTYFPAILMVILNLVMIQKIYSSSKILSNRSSSVSRKEHQFTRAVIAFDSYFFILNFPLSLYYIFNDVNSYSGALKGDLFVASYSLAGAIAGNM